MDLAREVDSFARLAADAEVGIEVRSHDAACNRLCFARGNFQIHRHARLQHADAARHGDGPGCGGGLEALDLQCALAAFDLRIDVGQIHPAHVIAPIALREGDRAANLRGRRAAAHRGVDGELAPGVHAAGLHQRVDQADIQLAENLQIQRAVNVQGNFALHRQQGLAAGAQARLDRGRDSGEVRPRVHIERGKTRGRGVGKPHAGGVQDDFARGRRETSLQPCMRLDRPLRQQIRHEHVDELRPDLACRCADIEGGRKFALEPEDRVLHTQLEMIDRHPVRERHLGRRQQLQFLPAVMRSGARDAQLTGIEVENRIRCRIGGIAAAAAGGAAPALPPRCGTLHHQLQSDRIGRPLPGQMHVARKSARRQVSAVQYELRMGAAAGRREGGAPIEAAADVHAEEAIEVAQVADAQVQLTAALGNARFDGHVAFGVSALPIGLAHDGVHAAACVALERDIDAERRGIEDAVCSQRSARRRRQTACLHLGGDACPAATRVPRACWSPRHRRRTMWAAR